MNKTLKAGILITILGVPALCFVFLKIFGNNEFDLPYYFPEFTEEGEIMVTNGDTVWTKTPVFSLASSSGDTLEINRGSIKVINFFFTRCGTICPIANKNLVKVAELFKNNKEVQFYGISVDPKFDTPDVLKEYEKALGMDLLNYKLLTGDKKYIYDLSISGFKLPVSDASEYDSNIKDVDEMFIHSDKVLLVDEEGYFRGIYSSVNSDDMDRLKLEIKVLLSQKEK